MTHLKTHWKKYLATAAVAYVGYAYGPAAQQTLVDLLAQIGLAPVLP